MALLCRCYNLDETWLFHIYQQVFNNAINSDSLNSEDLKSENLSPENGGDINPEDYSVVNPENSSVINPENYTYKEKRKKYIKEIYKEKAPNLSGLLKVLNCWNCWNKNSEKIFSIFKRIRLNQPCFRSYSERVKLMSPQQAFQRFCKR